ncbi:GTPase Era [Sesbania bispinosa]|nr:GTPase Era [Sesbania bispinosa]
METHNVAEEGDGCWCWATTSQGKDGAAERPEMAAGGWCWVTGDDDRQRFRRNADQQSAKAAGYGGTKRWSG